MGVGAAAAAAAAHGGRTSMMMRMAAAVGATDPTGHNNNNAAANLPPSLSRTQSVAAGGGGMPFGRRLTTAANTTTNTTPPQLAHAQQTQAQHPMVGQSQQAYGLAHGPPRMAPLNRQWSTASSVVAQNAQNYPAAAAALHARNPHDMMYTGQGRFSLFGRWVVLSRLTAHLCSLCSFIIVVSGLSTRSVRAHSLIYHTYTAYVNLEPSSLMPPTELASQKRSRESLVALQSTQSFHQDHHNSASRPALQEPMNGQPPPNMNGQPLTHGEMQEDLDGVLSKFLGGIKRRKLNPQYSQEIADMLNTIAEYVMPVPMNDHHHQHHHQHHQFYQTHSLGQQQIPQMLQSSASLAAPASSLQSSSPASFGMSDSDSRHFANPSDQPFPIGPYTSSLLDPSMAFDIPDVDMLLTPSVLQSATDIQQFNQFFSQLYADMETAADPFGNAADQYGGGSTPSISVTQVPSACMSEQSGMLSSGLSVSVDPAIEEFSFMEQLNSAIGRPQSSNILSNNDSLRPPQETVYSTSAPSSYTIERAMSGVQQTYVESDDEAALNLKNLQRGRSISDPDGDVDRFLNLDDSFNSGNGVNSARTSTLVEPTKADVKVSILLRGLKGLSLRCKDDSSKSKSSKSRIAHVSNSNAPSGRYPGKPTLAGQPSLSLVEQSSLASLTDQPSIMVGTNSKAPVDMMLSDPYSLTRRVIQGDSHPTLHAKAPLTRTDTRGGGPLTAMPPMFRAPSLQQMSSNSATATTTAMATTSMTTTSAKPPKALPLAPTPVPMPLTGRRSLQKYTAPLHRSVSQPVPHSHRRATVSAETRRKHLVLIGTFMKQLERVWKEVEAI